MAPASRPPRAWQRMLSGRRLDLLDPAPLDIEIEDIAHGLAFVARWNGQTKGDWPYSVAEHSLLVEEIYARLQPGAPAENRLFALLHDAPEYVIGDMISPVKHAIGPGYAEMDKRLAIAVHLRFGLSAEPSKMEKMRIKAADRISAFFEAVGIAGFSHSEAMRLFKPTRLDLMEGLAVKLRPPKEVREDFVDRYNTLAAKMAAQKRLLR